MWLSLMVAISRAERRANSLYKQSRRGEQIRRGKDKGGTSLHWQRASPCRADRQPQHRQRGATPGQPWAIADFNASCATPVLLIRNAPGGGWFSPGIQKFAGT